MNGIQGALDCNEPRSLSQHLDLNRIAAALPGESSRHRKSAHPNDLLALEYHWPARPLPGRNVSLGEKSLQLFFRLTVYGPEAIARVPVSDGQLRTEQFGAKQAIRWFLVREFLRHRDASHCQSNFCDADLARNRQDVLVAGAWRPRLRR